MAGQTHRGSRRRGRSSGLASSSAPLALLGAVPAGGIAPATLEPSSTTAGIATRATYRALLARGLAPDEAATLTAFLSGLPIADVRWDLRQVNRLLFLRERERHGRFGSHDGRPTGSH